MVEVIMLKPDAPSAGGSGDAADRPSVVASTGVVGSSSSTAPDSAAYAEKAIAKLPPHLATLLVLQYLTPILYISPLNVLDD